MSGEKREKKARTIDKLYDIFSKCSIGILTDYRGLTAAEIDVLRRKLREASIEYKVVKNTMARFAGEKARRSDLANLFEGPIAIAFGYDDIAVPAKILTDYINTSQTNLSIKGGFLSDRLLASEEVTTLSILPAREILLARILGGIQNPITSLVNCLNAPIMGITGVLQARIQQLEGE